MAREKRRSMPRAIYAFSCCFHVATDNHFLAKSVLSVPPDFATSEPGQVRRSDVADMVINRPCDRDAEAMHIVGVVAAQKIDQLLPILRAGVTDDLCVCVSVSA